MHSTVKRKKFLGIPFGREELEKELEEDYGVLPSSVKPVPIPKKALSIEDEMLKQMALRYFVDQSLTVREVAKKLNVTVRKLNLLTKDEDFIEELRSRVDRVMGMDSDFRLEQAKISITHLYEEIRRREAENELKDVPLRELHRMLIDMQKELRLDTPGEFTSKVGVGDLTSLQDRYKKSLSGRLRRKKAEIGSLSNRDNLRLAERSLEVDESISEEIESGED